MNKLLKALLYLVGGIAVLVVLMGLFAKKHYHIERSIDIAAPDSVIIAQVRYFKNFKKWSPWQDLDPNMKTTITGTDGEVGAVYAWEGNKDAGSGKQTLTAVSPQEIKIDVNFKEPFESDAPSSFKFEKNGDKVHVTWGFDMNIPFPWNGFAMFTDIDKSVGKDYERGLGYLKKLCENLMRKEYNGFLVDETEFRERIYVGYRDTLDTIPSMIEAFYRLYLPKAREAAEKEGGKIDGAPVGLFWQWGPKADQGVAFPVSPAPKKLGSAQSWTIKGGKALAIEYYGPYSQTIDAHIGIDLYMKEKKLRNIPPVIEEYITDPAKEPDTAKWLTKVIYFVEPIPVDSIAAGMVPADKKPAPAAQKPKKK